MAKMDEGVVRYRFKLARELLERAKGRKSWWRWWRVRDCEAALRVLQDERP